MKGLIAVALLCLTVALTPGIGRTDDVTDQINEGLKAYKAKDLETSIMALDTAASLIRQQKAEGLTRFLPSPLPGWQANDAESSYAGNAMMGGGINATRTYTLETGDKYQEVTISISSDSPMMQTLAMMFSNPMFAGGNKIMIIDGRKVMQDKDNNSLQTMIANKVLVEVDGSDDTDAATVKQYLQSVPLDQIEKSVK